MSIRRTAAWTAGLLLSTLVATPAFAACTFSAGDNYATCGGTNASGGACAWYAEPGTGSMICALAKPNTDRTSKVKVIGPTRIPLAKVSKRELPAAPRATPSTTN